MVNNGTVKMVYNGTVSNVALNGSSSLNHQFSLSSVTPNVAESTEPLATTFLPGSDPEISFTSPQMTSGTQKHNQENRFNKEESEKARLQQIRQKRTATLTIQWHSGKMSS